MIFDRVLPVSEYFEGDDEVKIKTLLSCTVIFSIHIRPRQL